jgi:ribonuclease HI
VYCYGTRLKHSFSLGQYTTVFQAEVYVIKACADANMNRNYKNRNIYVLSDSQAAIKALDKYQITSKLVWDCRQSLMQVAKHNRVQLICVPGHEVIIVGNETADQLARVGSDHPLIGPQPACGIAIGVAKKAVRDWMSRIHKEYWESLTGLKTDKGTYTRALYQKKKAKDLLRLNRDQLRWVVGLLTGHCHLKRHLFKLGITADPICVRCLEDNESSIHVLCDCEAVAYTRFRHLGQYFMERSDYYDAPIDKVLHFIRSVGLIKG